MATTAAHRAAIKNETASNGIDKATSKKESAKRKTSRSIGPSGDLVCASQAGTGAGGEVDGFTMILPGSYAGRSALASASVASLGAEMDVHRERFCWRPVRQREAMLYKNEAGITVARHAQSFAVEANPLSATQE